MAQGTQNVVVFSSWPVVSPFSFLFTRKTPHTLLLFQCGLLHKLQGDICISPMDLHGLQGHSLPHHGLHHGLQENVSSTAWSTSCPSALSLVSAELFLWHILNPLFSGCDCSWAVASFPFSKLLFQRCCLSPCWDQSWPALELTGIGSIRLGGRFQQLLTETAPVPSQLPKLYLTNPMLFFSVLSIWRKLKLKYPSVVC